MVMRVLNARFALGLGLFTVVFAIADSAQAGPFRRRAARRSAAVACCPPAPCCPPAVAYAPAGFSSGGAMYGAADPCCPQTGLAYGGSPAYFPGIQGGAYGGAMAMPSPGGTSSYYTPGTTTPSPMPGGNIPAPLPTSPGTSTTDALTKTVEITDTAFEPKNLTIEPGTTVKWTNRGQKPHTVTSDKGDWGSGELTNGQTFTATFTKAGEFGYHCKLHPDMKATITVK
jgi:plastocyanin